MIFSLEPTATLGAAALGALSVAGLIGFYIGFLKAKLTLSSQHQQKVLALETEIMALKTAQDKDQHHIADKLNWIEQAEKTLRDAFTSLSAHALQSNNQQFLQLAQQTFHQLHQSAQGDLAKNQHVLSEMLTPIQQSLLKFDSTLQSVEKTRVGAYEGLTQQIKQLSDSERHLRQETHQLVNSLKAPQVRGRWGELQLRRVIELAGMLHHCDFEEQASVETTDGRLRPDVLVRLPGQRNVVIDAKAPLASFLQAMEAPTPAEHLQKIKDHARHIRDHITALSRKSYWAQFQPSPEFVLLFLPGETFFSAALEVDPELIEFGAKQQVILATPTTLIALLKAVAYGWQQQKIAEQAQQISDLGSELYQRLAVVSSYFNDTGKHLSKAVESYNRCVSSFETRVMVSARKLHDLEAVRVEKELTVATPIEVMARHSDTETAIVDT